MYYAMGAQQVLCMPDLAYTLSSSDLAALGSDVVSDRRQQALCRRAVEHAQHARIGLGRKELEDGQHAPRTDVVAVQESQRVRNGVPAYCNLDSRNKEQGTAERVGVAKADAARFPGCGFNDP